MTGDNTMDMDKLLEVFTQAAADAGATVEGTGHGYSNGPYLDAEITLPDGFRVWISLEESADDQYLAERYPELYGETDE